MGALVTKIVGIGATGFVGQKALKCFGKKDYADVISFVTWCTVGVEVFLLIMGFNGMFQDWIKGATQVTTENSSWLGDFLRGLIEGLK